MCFSFRYCPAIKKAHTKARRLHKLLIINNLSLNLAAKPGYHLVLLRQTRGQTTFDVIGTTLKALALTNKGALQGANRTNSGYPNIILI